MLPCTNPSPPSLAYASILKKSKDSLNSDHVAKLNHDHVASKAADPFFAVFVLISFVCMLKATSHSPILCKCVSAVRYTDGVFPTLPVLVIIPLNFSRFTHSTHKNRY